MPRRGAQRKGVIVMSAVSTTHRTHDPHTPGTSTGTWCAELELSGAPQLRADLPFAGQPAARVLVRLHGEPLGYLTETTGPAGLDAAAVARRARTEFSAALAAHLAAEQLPAPDEALPAAGPGCPNRVHDQWSVSVVVCTRDRSDILAACLDRLRLLTHAPLEVIVVDNAPSDDSTRLLVEADAAVDPRFRYVVEPQPGLSAARNRGLAAARGQVVAYTDDDVAVDENWVQGLLRGFERGPAVGCVTGLVATAGIDGAAEEYFDARAASWSTRCEPELFDPQGTGRDGLYPFSPGIFGTGASFAFDRALLARLGGFDEALGAGTPTRGGEDLDVFVRVLLGGRSIAYEPSAVVWHHHRADEDALLRQMYGYGTGLSAFVAKCLLSSDTRGDVLRRLPRGLVRITRIKAQTGKRLATRSAEAPEGAMRREMSGFVAGPALYLRARRGLREPLTFDTEPGVAEFAVPAPVAASAGSR